MGRVVGGLHFQRRILPTLAVAAGLLRLKSEFLSIPLIVVSFFFAAPVHAVPLRWTFSGSTGTTSQFNGMPVGGLDVKFRIFLDTSLVASPLSLDRNDVIFFGPFQGELDLETFGVLPVFPISSVENFAPSQGGVVGVEYTQAGKSFINFPSIISADRAHLSPILPAAPTSIDTIHFGGPNGLDLVVKVETFSATAAVPEGGSTALLLTSGLIALRYLRRRNERSAA